MTQPTAISRRLLVAGAATATVLARPAIAQARPAIRLQAFGGPFEKIMRETAIPEFQKANNIDVALTVEDDTTILPKLQVARSRPPYDVVTLDNDKAMLGSGMGLWAPDQSGKMPNVAAVYSSCKPPSTANYGSTVYEYGFVYNTDKLKSPTSWQDLWTPGIVAGVPHITQSYGLTFLYIAAKLNGGGENDLEPGFEAIKRLKNFKIYKNVSEGLGLFQQKEIDAALYYSHRAQQMIDMGLPIAKTVPKEGTWGQRTGTQIPKSTPELEAAVKWVDFTMSAPYQAAFAKSLYSPTNRTVSLPPDLSAKLLVGDARVDAIREAPWATLLPQRDALLDRWTREFGA
jgi:putative spermidine/putrescine transport system substrate-binding protein